MYYIYMLRCKDNTIYTGITTDIHRRFQEHKEKQREKSKYTASHEVLKIDALWDTMDKKSACKLEYHIKKLSKKQKEEIINDNCNLENLLGEKIEIDSYKRVKNMKI